MKVDIKRPERNTTEFYNIRVGCFFLFSNMIFLKVQDAEEFLNSFNTGTEKMSTIFQGDCVVELVQDDVIMLREKD